MATMLSNRPYLLRAFYQWIIDSQCTPILVVDASMPGCKLPKEHRESQEVVFNIAPVAVRDLKIDNNLLEFRASFSGVIHIISMPIKAVLSIYAEENGDGIFFDAEDDQGDGTPNLAFSEQSSAENAEEADHKSKAPVVKGKGKPHLRLVE